MIRYLVFDVDDTLLDFRMSLYRAEKAVADRLGLQITEEYYLTDNKLIMTAWQESGLSQTSDPEARESWHLNYRLCILRYIECLAEHLGTDLDQNELTRLFLRSIGEMHHTMEKETLEVYIGLSAQYKNVLATNTVVEVRERLRPFEPYTYRVFLSDELHAVKPDRKFFDSIVRELACDPSECLMIGNSVTDDMMGAKNAGFYTCWYKRGKENVSCPDADYQIDSITELPILLESAAFLP